MRGTWMSEPAGRHSKLDAIMRAISLTRDVEIDCTTCLEFVPIYVDREVAGRNAAEELPDVHTHLALCHDCFEEYEAVYELARLEAQG